MAVTKVWIESGCIECRWCYELAPDVFTFGNGTSQIRGDARADRVTSTNADGKSELDTPRVGQMGEFLEFIAAGCPTSVIKLEVTELAEDAG